MLRDAVVDLIAFRLGQRNDLRNMIIAEMDHIIQTELSQQGHNFLWQRQQFGVIGALVAGETRINPGNVLKLDEDTPLSYVISGGGLQTPTLLQYVDGFIPAKFGANTDRGAPSAWTWIGLGIIEFDRIADKAYNICGRVYAGDPSIAGTYGDANNVETNWLLYGADVVIAAVGRRMSMSLMSDRLFQMFNNDYERAWNRAYTEDIAQREALADRAATDD